MQAHEYSIVGHDRALIGRYLGAISAVAASAMTAASVGLVDLLEKNGFPDWTQRWVLVPITGGLAYAVAHWLFNRFGWRFLSMFAQVPHIDGIWACAGRTMDSVGTSQYEWTGKITISQSWEKIRVRLQTSSSASNSVSAALVPGPDGCWTLMYSYRNEPRIGESELNAHVGYCELRFEKTQDWAEGDYFNAKGRVTFGRMTITKENNK
jgi:hypothetical protein